MLRKLFTASAIALLATASHAAVVYDNGTGFGGGVSNNAASWVQTDNFALVSAASITGGTVWLESQTSSLFSLGSSFSYWFFAGGATPGAVLQSGSASVVAQTDTGVQAQGGRDNIQRIDFDLDSDFAAMGATQYFFGIRLSGPSMAWSGAEPGNSQESLAGTFNNWFNNGRERAFLLNGNENAVPEPATLALVGLSLVGAAVARRRKNWLMGSEG